MRTNDEISEAIVNAMENISVDELFQSKELIDEIRIDVKSDGKELFSVSNKKHKSKFNWSAEDRRWIQRDVPYIDYIDLVFIEVDLSSPEMQQWVLVKDTPEFENFFLLLSMRAI